ncbi:hypothetical protein GG681_09455 [Epibacterium sp. SM1969]|uniref:Nickel/cobalt efflux system n=1 Tax=Tritonibacter aquimaris TaxID=2663379 RepID=A0A844AU07_9RHOB|nr:hypothetical protein [Tritonibacter aquimaris]MQY42868.1 hypothetical protein [Tritonibacter aquimaris]
MKRLSLPTLLMGAALVVLALILMGSADQISRWAAAEQQQVQNALARGLRALKTNQPGALMSLLGLCFAYGFFHAAGPGHGKLVIGGYGMGQKVPMMRLISLALASSLAQSLTAIALVVGGLTLLNWGRVELTSITEEILAPLSYALIAALGLWLVWRGLRKLRAPKPQAHHHHHDHHAHHHTHDHHHHHRDDGICADCGHKHGPTLNEVAAAHSLRDALAIIASVAIRPCTGALFLLLLTWRLDLMLAGVLGTLAMGLGTGSVTVAVAIAAVSLRQGTLARLPDTRRVTALLELCGGLLIFLLASQITLRLL